MSLGLISKILELFQSSGVDIEQDGDSLLLTFDISEYVDTGNVSASATVSDDTLVVKVDPDE